jgi:hypothetical protein
VPKLDVRLIVPGPAGDRIVVASDGSLPAFVAEVGESEASVIPVDAWLRESWALAVPILETHPKWRDVAEGEPIPTLALTEPVPQDWRPPAGVAFEPIPDEPAGIPAPIRPRAVELLAELRSGAPPPDLRPRWARRGWFDRASAWMRSAAAGAGHPLTGEPKPFFLRGISALLRAPTAGPDLFLKAVFPPFHAEPVLTRMLGERFPDAVPPVVATEDEEGWLLVEDIGSDWIGDLPEVDRPAGLRRGAEAIVRMQEAFGRDSAAIAALLGAGAPHRPLTTLANGVEAAIGPGGAAVEGGLEPDRAARVLDAIRGSVAAVERIGFPETVVHGDFHSGNAAIVDDRVVIIDWSDAAIGCPAVDLVTWIAWSEDHPAEVAAATDAWVEAWAPAVDVGRLRECVDDVLIVGAAYQLVSYDGIRRALEPATQYTMIGGGAQFLKHLERILDARAAAAS